jgi:amphi-Trp domain-containing protein
MSEIAETVSEPEDTNGASKDKSRVKVSFESSLSREEAVQYFSAILDGLKQGTLTFKQGDRSLTVEPPERLDLEVKAARKGREAKVSFEISWKDLEPADLEISSD